MIIAIFETKMIKKTCQRLNVVVYDKSGHFLVLKVTIWPKIGVPEHPSQTKMKCGTQNHTGSGLGNSLKYMDPLCTILGKMAYFWKGYFF